jgi:hypothetical protein
VRALAGIGAGWGDAAPAVSAQVAINAFAGDELLLLAMKRCRRVDTPPRRPDLRFPDISIIDLVVPSGGRRDIDPKSKGVVI